MSDPPSSRTSRILCIPIFAKIIGMCRFTATTKCTAIVAVSRTGMNEVAFRQKCCQMCLVIQGAIDIRFFRYSRMVCDSICWRMLLQMSMLGLVLTIVGGGVVGSVGESFCNLRTCVSFCPTVFLWLANQMYPWYMVQR